MSAHGLSDQQRRFADGILQGRTQRDAYANAGYKARGASADANAARLLKNAKVAAYLAEKRAKLEKKAEINAERVLRELARIAFADIRNLFTWDEERACYIPSRELTDDEAAAISSVKSKTVRYTREDGTEEERIELELKTYDKLSALEKIGKNLGMFTDKVEHTGPAGGPVEVQVTHRIIDSGNGDRD